MIKIWLYVIIAAFIATFWTGATLLFVIFAGWPGWTASVMFACTFILTLLIQTTLETSAGG